MLVLKFLDYVASSKMGNPSSVGSGEDLEGGTHDHREVISTYSRSETEENCEKNCRNNYKSNYYLISLTVKFEFVL